MSGIDEKAKRSEEEVQRDYIAKKKAGEQIREKTDYGLKDDFERLKGKFGGYISEGTYLNAWVKGSVDGIARISLLHTDGKGHKRVDEFKFEHYFWMRTADVTGRALSLLKKWRDGGTHAGKRFRVRRWEPDPNHPQWTRVFVDCPPDYFYTRTYLSDRDGGYFVIDVNEDGKTRRIQGTPPSLRCAMELEERKIPTFEADLNPIRRFVCDNPIRYPAANEMAEAYFDIEVDDRQRDIFKYLGKYRILSVCWVDKEGKPGKLVLEADTDAAERKMLQEFNRRVLEKVDVIASWNGYKFDYYYLFARMEKLGVKWRWWRNVFCDLLPVFKRYHFRAGSKNSSYALGAIGEAVLGDEGKKLEMTAIMDQRYPGWRQKYGGAVGTWAAWCVDKDLLVEYNVQDCEILRKIERFCGYGHLDFTFSSIGNCFPNDYHISTKVDGLMVRKGLVDGVHFPTFVRGRYEGAEQFEGGYVHEPVRGIHEEVCAFDFKSLYPSMMTTFNISPDTFVPESERHRYAPEDLITTPIGTTFVKPHQREDGTWANIGFIPQMFKETLERRKTYTDLQAKEEVGCDMFLHYYRLAYSYKRLGLSFYGELGNVRGRFYNPDVGRSTTLCGQYFIKNTMDFAKHLGFKPLYGDTDSMYVGMPREHGEDFVRQSQALYFSWYGADTFIDPFNKAVLNVADWVKTFPGSDDFYAPRPWNVNPKTSTVYLEYEDVYGRICFINKKRYFGRLDWHKGEPARHLEVKGLEVMRSDGAQMARALQERVMHAIAFENAGEEEVWAIVQAERERVLSGKCDVSELAWVKGLSKRIEDYKNPPPHVRVAAQIRDAGLEYYVGMKVPYILVRGFHVPRPDFSKMGTFKEKAEALQAWREAEARACSRRTVPPKPDPISVHHYDPADRTYDANYYWEKASYPPTLRIVHVAFPRRDWVSLAGEIARKRDNRIRKFRKGILDPAKRAETFAAIKKDATLTFEQREDLRRFYLTNVLGAASPEKSDTNGPAPVPAPGIAGERRTRRRPLPSPAQ
jgi:DNA polymerase elongation subunit (family B)